jgi:hypothetical protein
MFFIALALLIGPFALALARFRRLGACASRAAVKFGCGCAQSGWMLSAWSRWRCRSFCASFVAPLLTALPFAAQFVGFHLGRVHFCDGHAGFNDVRDHPYR